MSKHMDEADVLRDAVVIARNEFRRYAELHRAKGTPDGDAKAAHNEALQARMDEALNFSDRCRRRLL